MSHDSREHQNLSWQEAEAFGVDVNQLRANLFLTFEERVLQHSVALDLFEECLLAYQKRYGKIHPADQNS